MGDNYKVHRSCYCCTPYTEGFQYAIKMREKNGSDDIESIDSINPYDIESIEWNAFSDGYRDGLFTSKTHFY